MFVSGGPAMDNEVASDAGGTSSEMMVSASSLSLPGGIYAFTVRGVETTTTPEGLAVPAVQIGVAPITPPASVTFLTGPGTSDRWLARNGDVVVVRIDGDEARLLLTSLRSPDREPVTVDIRRLDGTEVSSRGMPASGEERSQRRASPLVERVLRVEILAHVQKSGDMVFLDGWAGSPGQQQWIEGFAVRPLEGIAPDLIEYRTLSAGGAESAWASDAVFCGSRGMGSPLIGFAIRLKADAARYYECQYSGSFFSGLTVGPVRDGAWCRSAIDGDPLDGVELRLVERRALASSIASGTATLDR
jgi:hypothetical protein